MIYDFIFSEDNKNEPLYHRLYLGIRTAIEKGAIKKGERIPSIRVMSEELKISKTTVEASYHQLCAEGYIISIPQSGFRVEAEFSNIAVNPAKTFNTKSNDIITVYEYDFGSKSVDLANYTEWRKYIKDILNKPYLLTSYGDPRGEPLLRHVLQRYSFGIRGVATDKDSIIIGAGTQALLYLLCGPLRTGNNIALEKGAYPHAEQMFKDFGFEIIYAPCDKFGIIPEELTKIHASTVLVNPNYTIKSGNIMPVQRRLDFINWAKNYDGIIIENDFNGELRYMNRPVPAIQSYDSEHVVYLGSFSKLLLPSVRIGYMAIPQSLKKRFDLISAKYNQTASKLEQLALAAYISAGKLETNLKRMRKIYAQRSKITLDSVEKYFGSDIPHILNETALNVALKVHDRQACEISSILLKNGINTVQDIYGDYNLILSFSGIKSDEIDKGVKKIASLILK